jgi:hypothetical protein
MIYRKIQMIFVFMMSFLCCVGYATDAEDIVSTLKAAWNTRGSAEFITYLDEPWNGKEYDNNLQYQCWETKYDGGWTPESAKDFNEKFGTSGLSYNHYKSCKLLTPEVSSIFKITVLGNEGDTVREVQYHAIEAPMEAWPSFTLETNPRKWAGFWYSTRFTKKDDKSWKMIYNYRLYQTWNWAVIGNIPDSTAPWYP